MSTERPREAESPAQKPETRSKKPEREFDNRGGWDFFFDPYEDIQAQDPKEKSPRASAEQNDTHEIKVVQKEERKEIEKSEKSFLMRKQPFLVKEMLHAMRGAKNIAEATAMYALAKRAYDEAFVGGSDKDLQALRIGLESEHKVLEAFAAKYPTAPPKDFMAWANAAERKQEYQKAVERRRERILDVINFAENGWHEMPRQKRREIRELLERVDFAHAQKSGEAAVSEVAERKAPSPSHIETPIPESKKKERIILPFDAIKNIISSQIGNKAKIKKLELSKAPEGVQLSADLDAGFLGGKISIKGFVTNVGNEISVQNLSVDARGYVKSQNDAPHRRAMRYQKVSKIYKSFVW